MHLTCISRFQSFKSLDHSGDWKNNIPRAITWWTKKSPGPIVKNNELRFSLTACFRDKQLCYDCKGTILVCESFIRYETASFGHGPKKEHPEEQYCHFFFVEVFLKLEVFLPRSLKYI